MNASDYYLVVFTSHYPFGNQESFFCNELSYLAKKFKRIAIVSYQKENFSNHRYVPENVDVFTPRKDYTYFQRILLVASIFLLPRVWTEFGKAIKNKEYPSRLILFEILRAEAMCKYLHKSESDWDTTDSTVIFYSYWLNSTTLYFGRNRKDNHIYIARAHGSDCYDQIEYHPFRSSQLQSVDHIFSISESGKKALIQKNQEIKEKISVSYLGVLKETDKMNPFQFGQELMIVSCSNVIKVKRLDILIEALSSLQDIRVKWVHFGDGDQFEAIKLLASEKLGNKENIIYSFEGRKKTSDILKFYETVPIDLFINCSDSEGIPVSIMEAMSYGIPCIARDVGGNKEIVNDQNGFLVIDEDISERIADIICHYNKLNTCSISTLRDNAHRTYLEKFCSQKNYSQFYEEIIQLAERKNERSIHSDSRYDGSK